MSVITLAPISANRGNTVVVSGKGLKANVSLILLIDKIVVNRFIASSNGTFSVNYVVPSTMAYGTHTVRVQALSGGHWWNQGNLLTLTVAPIVSTLIISNVTATKITQTGATISWSLSDYATGQVEYGTTINYGTLSTPELSYTWNHHIQTLSGLSVGTFYHYRVKSTTQDGRFAVSSDYTFTTLGTVLVLPVAPTGLVATSGNSLVSLVWGAV